MTNNAGMNYKLDTPTLGLLKFKPNMSVLYLCQGILIEIQLRGCFTCI